MIRDVIKIDLTDGERAAFKSLAGNKDFKTATEAIDKYILRLNGNLLAGTESERGASAEEFYKLRNFIYYWHKFLDLTKKEDVEEK